jgi:hypothetical protein
MDICMLVPWERKKLRELLRDFNTARELLLAFLEILEEEWIEEYTKEPLRFDDFTDGSSAFRRLNTVNEWIGLINENGIYLEELEGYDE